MSELTALLFDLETDLMQAASKAANLRDYAEGDLRGRLVGGLVWPLDAALSCVRALRADYGDPPEEL